MPETIAVLVCCALLVLALRTRRERYRRRRTIRAGLTGSRPCAVRRPPGGAAPLPGA